MMMEIFVSTLPGISLSCAFFLLMLGGVQGRIFYSKGYHRSKVLMIFCFLSVVECLMHFVAQSRAFTDKFTLFFTYLTIITMVTVPYFYLRSVSYFIAVPNLFYKAYTRTFLALLTIAVGGMIYYLLTGDDIYFIASQTVHTDNFFADSYTDRFGPPTYLLTIVLASGSGVVMLGALMLLRTVLRSSRDWYFICGLGLTIFCALRENILLPWSVDYYVPFVFMANLFEAFRMNSLSYREYMREKQQEPEIPLSASEKYQNSNLSEERIKQLADRISQVLQDEKLYLNPNLNSEELAKKIGIPTYQLSQVVNIGLNTTFFELLSQCRIEEVKRKFESEELKSETIINIAYASGFNSKSAFNTAFKKQTGMTPSAYRKQIGEAP